MKFFKNISLLLIVIFLSNCASQTQLQTAVDNSKRLELLIEKERKENDQLNAQRSVMESQLLIANNQIQKLKTDYQTAVDYNNILLAKAKEEKVKFETKIKALEATISQQNENNQKVVAALDQKIGDLADDKRELINENYKARKQVTKRKKRRR